MVKAMSIIESKYTFTRDDIDYSKFVDALKCANVEYINSITYKESWWMKYNGLAIIDLIKGHSIELFKLIPNNVIKTHAKHIIIYIAKYGTVELFKQIDENNNHFGIYFRDDVVEEIKEYCYTMFSFKIDCIKHYFKNEEELSFGAIIESDMFLLGNECKLLISAMKYINDIKTIEYVVNNLYKRQRLCIFEYSHKLFCENIQSVKYDVNNLSKIMDDGYCFIFNYIVENKKLNFKFYGVSVASELFAMKSIFNEKNGFISNPIKILLENQSVLYCSTV